MLTVYKDVQLKRIESLELVKQERIKATTLYDRQRTYEARFFGLVLFACGFSLAYQTWYTTEHLTGFLHQSISSLSTPFLPFWTQYMLDETSMFYGWAAKGINIFLRIILLFGVAIKKLILILLYSFTNIASTGSLGSSSVVFIVTITLIVIFMKLYISDVSIGSPLLWMSIKKANKK